MTSNNDLGDTDEELKALFAKLRGGLNRKDSDWVRENLEATEWGLALETLIFQMERKNLAVDDGSREKMYRLAERMHIDLAERRRCWKKL